MDIEKTMDTSGFYKPEVVLFYIKYKQIAST